MSIFINFCAILGAPFVGSSLLVQGGPSLACAASATIFLFVWFIWKVFYIPKLEVNPIKSQISEVDDESSSLLAPDEVRKKSF